MQQVEIPITKEVIQTSRGTTAVKQDEFLRISFVVVEGQLPVQYTFVIEKPGQDNIMNAMTGGIQVADLGDLARAKSAGPPQGV